MRLADEKVLDKKPDLRILSLGAGVQSSTLLMKIYNGEIAPVDAAIFADTGNEPKEVYDWFEFLKEKVESTENRFQMLEGANPINAKLNEMVSEALCLPRRSSWSPGGASAASCHAWKV